MNNLIRWYNQNRGVAILLIIVIALILIVIYTWNDIIENRIEENRINANNTENTTNTSNVVKSNTNTSIMTGDEVKDTVDKTNTDIISEFVEYCNEGMIEEAYNMLSNECIELLYPSLEDFKTNYYDKIFYMERAYDLEAWYVYSDIATYYITYTEDILSSGTTTSDDNRGDYISVIKEDDNYYVNISSYVGREEINKYETQENITVTINYFDVYMDYMIANITVENNTQNTICLDTKETTNAMYIYDENDVKYTALLNEVAEEQLQVRKGASTSLNIKFNKIYNPERELEGICFGDLVSNYEEYLAGNESKEKIYIDITI